MGENSHNTNTDAAKSESIARRSRAGRVAQLKKAAAVSTAYQTSYKSASDTREWTIAAEHNRIFAENAKTAEIAVGAINKSVRNKAKNPEKTTSFFTPKILRATVISLIVSVAAIGGAAGYVKLHSSGNTGFEKLYTSKDSAAVQNIEDSLAFTAESDVSAGDYAVANSAFEKYQQEQMTIKVSADGNVYTVSVPHLSTVADVLEDINITLTGEDFTNYPADMTLEPDMELMIGRITYSEYTTAEPIPFDTEYRSVQTIKRGSEIVEQYGSDGTVSRTYKQRFVNGELESETLVSENVTVYPQSQIVLRGSGGTYTNAAGVSYDYSHYIDVTATAYSTLSGVTYTGKTIALGMIAVDPNVIPLGSQVYIVGDYGDYGICSAEDTGGAIIGNKIDIYLGDDAEVLKNFGVRKMRVYILD